MSLIGNAESLGFELVPVTPDWETHYGPEQAAWAGLAIWIGGRNLCRHVPAGTGEVEDRLYLPLAPIVDWIVSSFTALAFEERAARYPTTSWLHESVEQWADAAPPRGLNEDEWIDEREGWWSRHFFRARADGAQLPNLAWTRDDEQLVLAWAPGPNYDGGLFALNGHFSVAWNEATEILDEFTARVAAWLRDAGAGGIYPWVRYERPLLDIDVSPLRAVEFLTGRSAADLRALFGAEDDERLFVALGLSGDRAEDPGSSPECQVLRDLSPNLSSDFGEVLVDVGRASNVESSEVGARWQGVRDLATDAKRAAISPQEAGMYAANAIRREMSLDGQPIENVSEFVERCGLQHEHVNMDGTADRMVVAARETGVPVSRSFETRRTEHEWARRFEAARALGHVLLDPLRGGAIGAASGPFARRSRAQRSGVFAAELLLPASALNKASGGRLDGAARADAFTRLLSTYGVGAQTAAHQLWHHGWLSSEDVRANLIDEFAASTG